MNKNIIALILYTVFWTTFLASTGTLTSGYHLVDDHEIIAFNAKLNEQGFTTTYRDIMKEDLTMRFRPFYYLDRLILVSLFGTNFLLWSIHHAVLAVLTSFLFFLFFYRQGFNFMNSFLFPFLILIGGQSAIWWRLGPAETLGIFLVSISMFFLIDYIKSRKKYILLISVFSMILASLTKESFLVIVPAYVILILYLEYENKAFSNIIRVIRAKISILLIFTILFAAAVYVITNSVGLNSIGYAGLDNSTSIGAYAYFFLSNVKDQNFFLIIIVGMLFLSIDYTYTNDLIGLKDRLASYISWLLICAAIVIPQYVLYFKSGLWERYLIPVSLGFAIIIIFISEELYKRIPSLLYKSYIVLIIIYISYVFYSSDMVKSARAFTLEGENINGFFSSIVSNTQKEDTILVILDPISNYEYGFSAKTYLGAKDRKNIRFYNYDIEPNDSFEAGLKDAFKSYFQASIVDQVNDNYPCIAVLPFNKNGQIISKTDSLFSYIRNDYGHYSVFTRPGNQ